MMLCDPHALVTAVGLRHRTILLVLLSWLVLWPQAGHTDVRVLIRFDASGHHIQRVVSRPALSDAARELERLKTLAPRLLPGVTPADLGLIELIWLGSEGQTLRISQAPDPRVARVPGRGGWAGGGRLLSGNAAVAASRQPIDAGAYLLDGPEQAVELRIVLPERRSPPMVHEEWSVILNPP